MLSNETNNSNIDLKKNDIDINQNMHKGMGIVKLISLFLIGFGGMIIIGLIIGLILVPFEMGEATKDGIAEFISLGVILVALGLAINKDIKWFKNDYKNWKGYLIGFGFGVAIILVSIAYQEIINLFRAYEISENERRLRAIISLYPALSIIFFCFIGPVCEEITYRVSLFNIFENKRWLAYLISIIVFTLAHFGFTSSDIIGELINLPIYLLSAFALTFAYDKFGLAASLTAHTCNNLYAVIRYIIIGN